MDQKKCYRERYLLIHRTEDCTYDLTGSKVFYITRKQEGIDKEL